MQLDLYGWFPEANKKVLSELISKHGIKTVIEIGCFLGKSTAFFASQGCQITSIDTFLGASDLNDCEEVKKRLPTLYQQFLFNLKALKIEDKVTVIKDSSVNIALKQSELNADLVYIDGSHLYEDIKQDICLWLPRAKKIICGDDYTSQHPGVRRAVDELLPWSNKNNRCWYFIKHYE